MRKSHFILLASTLIIAGCLKPQATGVEYTNQNMLQPHLSQQVTTQNLSEPGAINTPQDNLCPSSEYSELVGKKYQDIPEDKLPPYFRTLKPGQNLIMSQPARVNLYLDNRGIVTTVRCG